MTWRFVLPVLTVMITGCAMQHVSVEELIDRARRNEVAAANSTSDRFVLVSGTVLDIAFFRRDQYVTSGTSGRVGYVGVSNSTTRRQSTQLPYVSVRASDGTVVFCFLDHSRLQDADRIEKGKTARLSGGFSNFSRDESGGLQVTLSACRLED